MIYAVTYSSKKWTRCKDFANFSAASKFAKSKVTDYPAVLSILDDKMRTIKEIRYFANGNTTETHFDLK